MSTDGSGDRSSASLPAPPPRPLLNPSIEQPADAFESSARFSRSEIDAYHRNRWRRRREGFYDASPCHYRPPPSIPLGVARVSASLQPFSIGNEEYPLLHPSPLCPVPNPEHASESESNSECLRMKDVADKKFQSVIAAELPSPIPNRAKSRHTSESLSHSNEHFASLRVCSLVLQLAVGPLVIASVIHSVDMHSPQLRTFRSFIIIATVGGISIALTDFVTWRWTCRSEPNADRAKMISLAHLRLSPYFISHSPIPEWNSRHRFLHHPLFIDVPRPGFLL